MARRGPEAGEELVAAVVEDAFELAPDQQAVREIVQGDGVLDAVIASGRPEFAKARLERLASIYPNRLYVELQRHGIEAERVVEPALIDFAFAAGLPMALVLIADPMAAPRTLGRTLVALYHFSQAEACLAVLLGRGMTLKEAAAERDVGIETVRTQLRSMLQKVGVHRQADLVRVLARLPEVRVRSPGSGG